MSIEVELNRKGGRICKHALAGEIHCPLIVRPTSEDVVTGNVFGMLQYVRPHLWLNQMLNEALSTNEFRQVWFKDFSLRLWERQPRYPPELLDFKEGHPEPDVVIEWENPPTTVWIEAKWRSPIARSSSNAEDNDQVTRDLRALMYYAGHVTTGRLIDPPVRRPILVTLFAESTGIERTPPVMGFRSAFPHRQSPVAVYTWRQLKDSLVTEQASMDSAEASIAKRAGSYLAYKLANRHRMNPPGDDRQFRFGRE